MEWEIIIHKEKKYIEVITSGNADNHGSLDMAKSIMEANRKNRITRTLVDHRNITSISGGVVEIYERPKILQLLGLILKIKIAEVVKPEHEQHFRFFETVCKNQGIQLEIFYEKESALNWLIK